MQTTNRPARALPWITNNRHEVITAKDFHGVANCRKDQDAAYIVHACNAYPRLMETLREIGKWTDAAVYTKAGEAESFGGEARKCNELARALLAELEEG